MSKYIVKSCPNLTTSYYADGDIIHNQCGLTDDDALCQDCTDCVMKQIVELCKEDLKPVREWQEGDTVFIEYKKDVHLANNILQLLQIEVLDET